MRRSGACCISLTTILLFATRFSNAVDGNSIRVNDNGVVYKEVVTDKGLVRGYRADDGEYLSFLGIPYAAPPTGHHRFKTPLPVTPWSGVFEANRTVMCPQRGIGEEDCLVVNVFTPMTTGKPLPVLVYIHGGSFIMGVGTIKGFTPLMNQDIIVVTLNYRLGALGFLCLGTEDAPGNAGLKDQVAALRWVNNNIVNFGGDSQEVTIFGLSAGAAAAEFLILSKLTKGLFQRAIIESSSVMSAYSTSIDSVTHSHTLASALDFPITNDLAELVSHYQNVSIDKLTDINYEYYINLTSGVFGFVPCVEKKLDGIDPFITDAPLNILRKGDYESVPIMFSYATAEGLYMRSTEYYEENYKDKMNANFADFIPGDLAFDTNEIKANVVETTKRFYFGNKTVSEDTLMEYLNYFGDYTIIYPIINSIKYHVTKSNNPIYLFEFAYKGNMGSEDEFYKDINLPGHGDIVKHAILIKPILSEEDRIAVDRISIIIGNFVKYGNPIPTPSALLNVTWQPIRRDNFSYIFIDKDIHVIQDQPYPERTKFWDELYKNYRQEIYPVDYYNSASVRSLQDYSTNFIL